MKNSSGRALLLSAYDAYSHRQWHTTVTGMFPDITWTRLTLPPRHFRWRLRGNSLSWAFKHRRQLTDNHDFLLCTSMTDLSALRGFVPELGRLPTAVYFHENQFAYPGRDDPLDGVEPRMLNLYTALCADELVFNSHYNHDSFLSGVGALLKKLPDAVPGGLMEQLSQAHIIPVPLPDGLYQPRSSPRPAGRPLTLVWNHRWEFDKGPERLLSLIRRLTRTGMAFRLHLLGQQFRRQPPAFGAMLRLLDEHYRKQAIEPGHCGFIEDRSSYLALLDESDVVLSTADHDFQGLSVLEGVARGCTPLAPARLVYPEYLAPECLYGGDGGVETEAGEAADRLLHWEALQRQGQSLPDPQMPDFSAAALHEPYRQLLERLSCRAGIR